jgi:hypothetical protein
VPPFAIELAAHVLVTEHQEKEDADEVQKKDDQAPCDRRGRIGLAHQDPYEDRGDEDEVENGRDTENPGWKIVPVVGEVREHDRLSKATNEERRTENGEPRTENEKNDNLFFILRSRFSVLRSSLIGDVQQGWA